MQSPVNSEGKHFMNYGRVQTLWLAAILAGTTTASADLRALSPSRPATGGPGRLGTWSRPDKTGYGTSPNRPVWFTLASGALSEIAYPTVDLVQTRDTFLMVHDESRGMLWDERADCRSDVARFPGTLAYEVRSDCPDAIVQKTFVSSSDDDAVLADYRIRWKRSGNFTLYMVHNPTAGATAGGDGIRVLLDNRGEPVLRAWQADVRGDEPASVHPRASHRVSWTLAGAKATVGFEGVNSPEDILKVRGPLRSSLTDLPDTTEATYGNVEGALVARVTAGAGETAFRLVIDFQASEIASRGADQRLSHLLHHPIQALLREQSQDWAAYLSQLNFDRSDLLAESSVLLLKALEDRVHPGALIAAPANPALPVWREAPEQPYEEARLRRNDANSGYRRVWPRDLYHKAVALLSVGDRRTPAQIARWYRSVQLSDGTWSQNMWVDGTPSWQGYQADQTALPLVLIDRLQSAGIVGYAEFRDMVRRAADTLVRRGPGTAQERWEENGGLSPNTFAAVIQGLRAAARLERSGDGSASLGRSYDETATQWQDQLKNWLLIRHGFYGDGYFARLEISSPWNPQQQDWLHIANLPASAQRSFREDEILDGGFLEWIIAGLVDPQDPDFTRTLRLYDEKVRKPTPFGPGYLRYNHDAYGENYLGGAWPLLSAERALAAIERREPRAEVDKHLYFIRSMATPAGLIGEQDTLAVRPLGWSHASYLILRRSLAEGRSWYRYTEGPARDRR